MLLSTKIAGDKVGLSDTSIRRLIRQGKIVAQKIGRDYMIDEKDLKDFENGRKRRKC